MSDGLLYCTVAGPAGILAEAYFKNDALNYKDVIQDILEKLQISEGKKSYTLSGYNFLCSVAKQITFIVVYKEKVGLRIPTAFLDDITLIWFNQYANEGVSAQPMAMNNQFSRIMKQKMEFYSNPSADKIKVINTQIGKVTEQIKENLDKTIQRQQNISLLVEKTDSLQSGSFQFKTQAATMKRVFWWRNVKLWAILIIIILIIIVIVLLSVCGLKLEKCSISTNSTPRPPGPPSAPNGPLPPGQSLEVSASSLARFLHLAFTGE